jgi:hypothetical protein
MRWAKRLIRVTLAHPATPFADAILEHDRNIGGPVSEGSPSVNLTAPAPI